MTKVYGVLVVLLTLTTVLFLAGCNTADSPRTADSVAKITDSELETSIADKFKADPELSAADIDVDADVEKNEVKLSGTVASQAMRSRAVELAKSAHVGLIVTDTIDVRPAELSRAEYTDDRAAEERTRARNAGDTLGDSVDDAWIHMKVVGQLIGDPDTPARKINVDVVNGVVTLRGNIDSAEKKAEAERIATETEGVKSVKNQLKVAPSQSGQ
jgi:hyperosmotically inducible periplasmic protein